MAKTLTRIESGQIWKTESRTALAAWICLKTDLERVKLDGDPNRGFI
jgi:hypothetical protein